MRYFLTADTHFSHYNIIKYCNRPFKTVEEMDEKIIKNWNERVKSDDLVYFLGDWCFKSGTGRGEGEPIKADFYRKQLNGNIIFIKGNHDKSSSLKTNIERMVITFSNYRINLVHKPEHADSNYILNICGHVHNNWRIKRVLTNNTLYDILNCGVDVNKFRPILLDEAIGQWHRWKKEHNYE